MLSRVLVYLVATNVVKLSYSTATRGSAMVNKAIDFEVFGKVQGVFFRKCITTGCIKSKRQPQQHREDSVPLNVIHFNDNLPEHSLPGLHVQHPFLYSPVSIEFEVYGKVHGVHFEEFTKEQADKLGVRGWCMNTSRGTVQGQLQGSEDNVQSMMNWLKTKGSPASEIERAEFRNQREILELTFNDFTIRRE